MTVEKKEMLIKYRGWWCGFFDERDIRKKKWHEHSYVNGVKMDMK